MSAQGSFAEMVAARLLKNAAAYELSLTEPSTPALLAEDAEEDIIATSVSSPLYAARLANAKRWRVTPSVCLSRNVFTRLITTQEPVPPVDSPVVRIDREVTAYLKHQFLATDLHPATNPLVFWKQHSAEYPILSTVACRFLNVPATSAEAERGFSTSGRILSPLRASLKPQTADKLIFLSHNARHFLALPKADAGSEKQ